LPDGLYSPNNIWARAVPPSCPGYLPDDAGELVFRLPGVPPEWQFLIDVIPAQLAAERLARLSGVDCDSFRLCSYIVEHEWGLSHQKVGVPKVET